MVCIGDYKDEIKLLVSESVFWRYFRLQIFKSLLKATICFQNKHLTETNIWRKGYTDNLTSLVLLYPFQLLCAVAQFSSLVSRQNGVSWFFKCREKLTFTQYELCNYFWLLQCFLASCLISSCCMAMRSCSSPLISQWQAWYFIIMEVQTPSLHKFFTFILTKWTPGQQNGQLKAYFENDHYTYFA